MLFVKQPLTAIIPTPARRLSLPRPESSLSAQLINMLTLSIGLQLFIRLMEDVVSPITYVTLLLLYIWLAALLAA